MQQNDFESEETARYSVDQAPQTKKAGHQVETSGAADRVKLSQIENAIDALLAE